MSLHTLDSFKCRLGSRQISRVSVRHSGVEVYTGPSRGAH